MPLRRKSYFVVWQKTQGLGDLLGETAEGLSKMIINQLQRQTASFLLESAFHEEEKFDYPAEELANNIIMVQGLRTHKNIVKIDTGLNLPS